MNATAANAIPDAGPHKTVAASITPTELAALRSAGGAVELIDVRTPVEFAELHAQGARPVPLDRLDVRELLSAHSAGDPPIYLICKSGARAAQARERCVAAGLGDAVRLVEGGTDAWLRAGLPVVRSPKVISLERQVRIAAGLLVLVGVVLGAAVHPALYGLSAFVGAGLIFAGLTNTCGMGMLIAKMPWNRRTSECQP
jgi:rhodanese-related sulfurtransferase